jgi:hypothetical protein
MLNSRAWTIVGAQWLSLFGSRLHTLALPLIIFRETGSTTQMSLGFLAETFPWIFLSPSTASWISKIRPNRVLFFCDIVRAGLCFLLMISNFAGIHFLAIMFFLGCLNSLYGGSRLALLKSSVDGESLQKVIAINNTGSEVIQIAAPAIGAAIVSIYPEPRFLLAIDAATFVLSAIIISIVRVNAAIPKYSTSNRATFGDFWRHTTLYGTALSEGFRSAAEALFVPLIVVIVSDQFHLSSAYFGISQATLSMGGMVIGVLASKLTRLTADHRLQFAALLMIAAVLVLLTLTDNVLHLLVLTFLLGLAGGFRQLFAEVNLARICKQNNVVFFASLYNAVISSAYVAGYGLGAIINGIDIKIYLAALFCCLGAMINIFLYRSNYE